MDYAKLTKKETRYLEIGIWIHTKWANLAEWAKKCNGSDQFLSMKSVDGDFHKLVHHGKMKHHE